MLDRDDAVRSVTMGNPRRGVLVLTVAGAVVVALLALSSSGEDPAEEPAVAPATTSTATTLPVGQPFPALAGHQVLVHSDPDLVVDLGTGRLEPPPEPVFRPQRGGERRFNGTVLASTEERVAVSTCIEPECGIAVMDDRTGNVQLWLPGEGVGRARAAFSADGRHLAYFLGEPGEGVTLWRIIVVDLETGERLEAGPVFQDTFVVLDGGRYVVSPLPEGLLVSDAETGDLTPLALHVRVEAVALYD